MPSLLLVMYKLKCQTAILWSMSQSVEILLPSVFLFGLDELKKFSTDLNVSYDDTRVLEVLEGLIKNYFK